MPVDDLLLESTALGICDAPVNVQPVVLVEIKDFVDEAEIVNVIGMPAHGHLESRWHILCVDGMTNFSNCSPSAMVMLWLL